MDGYAVRAADTPGPAARRRPVGCRLARSQRASELGRGDRHLDRGSRAGGGGCGRPGRAQRARRRRRARRRGDGRRARPSARRRCAQRRDDRAPAGQLLGPTQVGALAAVGLASVVCARRPRVAVLATGTELRAPGEPLGPGEIYESNSALIAAQLAVRRAASRSCSTRWQTTRPRRARRSSRGLESDVLITSGGVSVGPHDLVRARAGGARRERGVLARRRQARQADRVRRRAERRSCSACRATPSRRSSASSSSSAPRCSRCRARPGPRPAFLPGRARASTCARNDAAGRARPGACPRRAGGRRARAADRTGLAHDRARVPRPTRSCSFRAATACCRPARRSATCRSSAGLAPDRATTLFGHASPRPGRQHDRAHELAQRAARRPLRRRRIRARSGPRRRRRAARAHAAPPSAIATAGDLHVADRDQLEQIPRRVEARGRTGSRTTTISRSARRARRGRRATRAGALAAANLRQPEPRVHGGQEEDQRERVCCQNEQRDDAEREQRRRLARELLVRRDRRGAGRAGAARRASRRARRDRAPSSATTGQSPDACRSRASAAAAPPVRPGAEPRGTRRRRARRRARRRGGCAGCAPRAASGIPRRRQWAKRSTTRDEERDQQAEQEQLDRPAADDPVARPDEARRSLRELRGPGRASRRAPGRRGPSRRVAPCRAASARSVNASGRPLAGGRQA